MTILRSLATGARRLRGRLPAVSARVHLAFGLSSLLSSIVLVALFAGFVPDRRSAVQEGAILEPLAARTLIEKLFTCSDPFTDPAGRPTMIRIAESEIERRFG
mgnify:CR=1 FL=1